MNEAFQLFKATREYFTPVLTESAFNEKGMLTPEEFVRAGDNLVRICPSWQWESGEKTKLRPYLPVDKQFLSTKGVPSYRRLTALTGSKLVEETIKADMGAREGDWCAPELLAADDDRLDDAVLVDVDDFNDSNEAKPFSTSAAVTNNKLNVQPAITVKDTEYEDMEDASLALDDEATTATGANVASQGVADGENSLVRSRRYDVSITYDNYYRTPRIWLFGYDENGSTLSTNDIFQDIMQDYAKKTVTVDPHPHLSRPHASVHPCQHASAMLHIIEALRECGDVPSVDQYMFVFLKFIQSVIPTIEYDYTIDVQVRGKDAADSSSGGGGGEASSSSAKA